MLAVSGAPPLAVHVYGLLFLTGRIGHAVGISQTTATSLGRTGGTLLTWVAFIFAITVLLFNAIS
jgi:uncharacterized membrane protein YecN with MAPEG domain